MEVLTIGLPNCAAPALVIPTPGVPFGVEIRSVQEDVMPPIRSQHRCPALVEAKGPGEAPRVGCVAGDIDVPGLASPEDRCVSWGAEREHLIEPLIV